MQQVCCFATKLKRILGLVQGQGCVKEACADCGMRSCLLRRVYRQVTRFCHQDDCLALTVAIERLYKNNDEPSKEGDF